MSVTKKEFGKIRSGETVYAYTLENSKGMSAVVLNYGGIVRNLYVPDKDGAKADVVLGRETAEDYLKNDGYLGALIGRHANRIAKGKFVLNGEEYSVGINENANSLHGGVKGFDQYIWNEEKLGESSITLGITSPDGDEGFPGEVKVSVTYTVTEDNALRIEYIAKSDKDTVINLTNHSYFNLAGFAGGEIYDQTLQLNSSFYTPNDAEGMPTGEILSVTGTPFDFREEKPIGRDIRADHEQLKLFGGYDHNYVVEGSGFRCAARAACPSNGIHMSVYTDQPGIQLYTSNGLPEGTYKEGVHNGPHHAFCLETQVFPNGMEYSHFPQPILRAGGTYHTVTEYRFSAE